MKRWIHAKIDTTDEFVKFQEVTESADSTELTDDISEVIYNSDESGLFQEFATKIGTSDIDRKNAIEARRDGSVYMWIEGEYMKINDLLAMLAHETY